MSRRTIVFAVAGLALAAFAIAAFLYNGRDEIAPAPPIAAAAEVETESPVVPPMDTQEVQVGESKIAAPASVATPEPTWNALVRRHSPVIGPPDARVTIVEFFDPSCEACRAFYPIVKQIMAQYPNDVRLVLRYTPLHQGSDEAVRILETARMQNLFEPVLEALLAQQSQWATHGAPQLDRAWAAAETAGLDLTQARASMLAPHITATLNQDIADGRTVGISRTPTFFVNGQPLPSFGPQQLYDLVRAEVELIER